MSETEKKTRNRGPNAATASREITRRMDRLSVELLDLASSKKADDAMTIAQRLDVFLAVGKYLAIKNRGSADDDGKGEGLSDYADRIGESANPRGASRRTTPIELGGSNAENGNHRARATHPNDTGGSLLRRFKSRLPGDGGSPVGNSSDPIG